MSIQNYSNFDKGLDLPDCKVALKRSVQQNCFFLRVGVCFASEAQILDDCIIKFGYHTRQFSDIFFLQLTTLDHKIRLFTPFKNLFNSNKKNVDQSFLDIIIFLFYYV